MRINVNYVGEIFSYLEFISVALVFPPFRRSLCVIFLLSPNSRDCLSAFPPPTPTPPPPGCKCCTWVIVSVGVIKAACSEEKKKAAIKTIFKSLISVFSVVLSEKRHWQPRSLTPFGALIVLTVVKVCMLHRNLNHWTINVCCLLHLLWLCMWAIVIWPQIKSTYLSFQMGKASLYKKHLTTPFNSASVIWSNEVNPVRNPAKYH